MKHISKRLTLSAALFAVTLTAFAQLPQDPAVRRGTLKNGMSYYIRHNSKEAGLAEGGKHTRGAAAARTGTLP